MGVGLVSNVANATTPAPTVPGAPQNPIATPGPAEVTLSWQAPLSNGGSPITGYNVYRLNNDTPVLIFTVGADVLSYVDHNPPTIVNVYYITAVNAVGDGGHSATVSAQPQQANSNDSMLYIGIGAVVVIAVVVAYLVMRRKK
jgi:titin